MSELAYNYKGRRFVLPEEAAFWSVERLRDDHRGQVEVVRTRDGLPLIVPIEATIDEFQARVEHRQGRYRLTALDGAKLEIVGLPAAHVTVPTMPREIRERRDEEPELHVVERQVAAAAPTTPMVTAPFGTWPALPMPATMNGAEYLLAEALRGHVQMFQVLATALSDRCAANADGAARMMGAAAELLRAADGAAMPRRDPRPEPPAPPPPSTPEPDPSPPTPIIYAMPRNAGFAEAEEEDGGEDGDDVSAQEEADFFGKANKLLFNLANVAKPVSDLAKTLLNKSAGDGGAPMRNAAPQATPCDDEDEDGEADGAPSHLVTSHLLLISHELGAEDGSLFRRLIVRMTPAQRAPLIELLSELSIDEAVQVAAEQVERYRARASKRAPATAADVTDDGREPEPGANETEDEVAPPDTETSPTVPAPQPPVAARLEPRPITPDVMEHMKRIAAHLNLVETMQIKGIIDSAPVAERNAWIERLMAASPAEGAALARAELARRGA